MTAIVGLKYNGGVYIGADSFMGNSMWYELTGPNQSKLVRMSSDMVVGVAGTPEMSSLLRYKVKLQPQHSHLSIDEYMYNFAENVKSEAKMHGIATIENGKYWFSGQLLVGYKSSLYIIDQRFHAIEQGRDYASIGIGMMWTDAVMSALTTGNPKARITKALQSAVDHTPHVKPPFEIVKV